MNKIKSIILDQTNWLEVNIENEEGIIIHCESFGDSDEYQALVMQRCSEFGVEVTIELEDILTEQKSKRYIPTSEEIAQQQAEEARVVLVQQLAEAQAYLNSTDFYYARFLETGEAVPEEVVAKRVEARELINTLKVELDKLQGGN